ncbi:MAG: hypothetical protein K8F53_07310 [Rhodocyclaceae bacterium]|jgi:hypothetical protein|nr:hypothetical protein [Rhodocyclaceae bacterium]
MRILLTVSACLATLVLAGCAGHTHSLIPEGSDRELTVGTFRHEGPDEPVMVLEFGGTRFEARGFAIQRNQNLAELRKQYYPSRHYDQIFSGADTDHYAYSAQPVLRAGNGATLRCFAVWRSAGSPAGHCVTSDGVHINFRFE